MHGLSGSTYDPLLTSNSSHRSGKRDNSIGCVGQRPVAFIIGKNSSVEDGTISVLFWSFLFTQEVSILREYDTVSAICMEKIMGYVKMCPVIVSAGLQIHKCQIYRGMLSSRLALSFLWIPIRCQNLCECMHLWKKIILKIASFQLMGFPMTWL